MQRLHDCGLLPDLLECLDYSDKQCLERIPFFELELERAYKRQLLQHSWTPELRSRLPDGPQPFRRRWAHVVRAIEFVLCPCGEGVLHLDRSSSISDRCAKCQDPGWWAVWNLHSEWQLMGLPLRDVQEAALKYVQDSGYDSDGDGDDNSDGDYDSDGDEFARRWRRPEDMSLTNLREHLVQSLAVARLGLYEVALRTAIKHFEDTSLSTERTTMWREEERTRAANTFAELYARELKMREQYRAMRSRGALALEIALGSSLLLLPKSF
jgi:hypothetical protein